MSKKLFLLEAPGKLKKLRQILGSEYIVKASGGHIRELAKDGNLGFDLNGDRISCRFVPRNPQAKKTIVELKEIVRQVDTVILATDEDREGEIIAWHIKDALKLRFDLENFSDFSKMFLEFFFVLWVHFRTRRDFDIHFTQFYSHFPS
jgi:DNA topoisomerase-1